VQTRWAAQVDLDGPLPAHPRPQLVRDLPWVNLNGRWDYAFMASNGRPGGWDGTIVVPFSPETLLSGVERQLQADEWLWYRRTGIAAPQPPDGGRVLLHFGAVDQSCTVWVNGVEVGRHTGGYLPFTVDVTEQLASAGEPVETIEVRVRDLSETAPHARGKQRLDRGTIWYTAQSGIWQTVWLEAVPSPWIEELVVTPDVAGGRFEVTAHTSDGEVHRRIVVPDEPRGWTPDDPHLHWFDVEVGADTVRTYGGLREFGVSPDRRVTLNGAVFPQVGVLDQGYWPESLMTPPTDEAMVHDIATMKELGFTLLRKHAKVEPLRWYFHCDRLGMLVWQDVVNGGGRYRDLTTFRPARHPFWVPDRWHRLFGRSDAAGRAAFREEVRRTVRLLRNSPSVVVWTPFNEGWGQFDANAVAREVKRLDPTRLVNHVSGWIDQGGGDIRSFHNYLRPFRLRRRPGDRRVHALTEYGGYSLRVEGHDWSDREHGYRHLETSDELAAAFVRLHEEEIVPAVLDGLAATVYTQLSDVEDELNGLLTWDREVLKIPVDVVREVTSRLRRSFLHA
jgi:hypothetical protein